MKLTETKTNLTVTHSHYQCWILVNYGSEDRELSPSVLESSAPTHSVEESVAARLLSEQSTFARQICAAFQASDAA